MYILYLYLLFILTSRYSCVSFLRAVEINHTLIYLKFKLVISVPRVFLTFLLGICGITVSLWEKFDKPKYRSLRYITHRHTHKSKL